MRYPHIYHAVHHEPWLITEAFHHSMAGVLHSRLYGANLDLSQPDPGALTSAFANRRRELAAAQLLQGCSPWAPAALEDGIATVFICGVIAKGMTGMEKLCSGGVGPEDIARSLRVAAEATDKIIAYIDSPGGTVGMIPELGDLVVSLRRSGKDIRVYSDGQICSAAYWLAAGAKGVYGTRLSSIGSVGVYVPWLDATEAYAKAGYKVEIIKDGKHKGDGYPGTALTEEAKKHILERVQTIGADFRNHVKSYRPRIAREDMEGLSYDGRQAATKGFLDGIVGGIEDVRRMLKASA